MGKLDQSIAHMTRRILQRTQAISWDTQIIERRTQVCSQMTPVVLYIIQIRRHHARPINGLGNN